MKKVIVVLTVLAFFACATEKGATPAKTADAAKPPQKAVAAVPASAQTPAPAPLPGHDILDPGVMNLARVKATEEPKWMNAAGSAEQKRLYKMGTYSIVLPYDLVPVTTRICPCSRLFKFTKADAWVYAFVPDKLEATALLGLDLNTADLARARGYHDVAVDMSGGMLRMSYIYDGADDGYTRWVEVRKNFSAGKMTAFALAVKDPGQLAAMRQKFRAALRTVKPPIE
jgi:hypothetical protein